jgi:hypothetical protein
MHNGNYVDRPIFTDLVNVMVLLRDKETRSVGHQNFRYGRALDLFAEECFAISPQLYRQMSKVLPLRSESSTR